MKLHPVISFDQNCFVDDANWKLLYRWSTTTFTSGCYEYERARDS